MHDNASHPDALLRIGELSRRTGVPTATLRSWEARHGFPASTRFDAGHRRYDEQQVELVTEVARLRRSGLPVPAAIRQATEVADRSANSFFAVLRSADHGLQSHLLGKRALSAVTAARRGSAIWRPLALMSLAFTLAAGGMAVAYWTILREFDVTWFLPNLALLIWPLFYLPALVRELANGAR